VSTVEQIKAATAKLEPDEQFELFKGWVSTDTFKQRQLAALKHDIAVGIEQLDRGQYRTFDGADVMKLAEDVSQSGKARLNRGRTKPGK
jgi:hypothetical protein